jgi:Rad3-related DNA helicase
MNNFNLAELIHTAFNPHGIVVSLGGRYVKEQYQYAQAVGEALIRSDDALAIIEAETGVGKSLGYLIPCLIFLSINSDANQIIISTFTRLLQKQIMHKDMPFAIRVVEQLDLTPASCAYRMGRQAFFCLDRMEYTIEKLKAKYAPDDEYCGQLDEFLSFAVDSCSNGNGLWLDWLEEYYTFPNHVNSRDICLLYDGRISNDAYIRHINQAASARLLLTNHATLIGHDTVTDFSESAYMIIADEAHHLDRLMAERSNKILPLARIHHLLGCARDFRVGAPYIRETRQFLNHWMESVIQYDKANGSYQDYYVSSGGHKQWLSDQIDFVAHLEANLRHLEKDCREFQKNNSLDHLQVECLEQLDEALITLSHWRSSNDYLYRAVLFSDNVRNPSLAVVNPIASRLFAHTVKRLTSRIMITSATLFDNRPDDKAIAVAGDLGFSHESVTCLLKLTPSVYGEMRFVLPSKDVSVPTSYDRDNRCNRFNQYWLKYTTAMIREAVKTGPTLVLTYSFEESRLLREHLIGLGVRCITQDAGTRLMECLPEFLNGACDVLITPSGWDGLNIRTQDNRQLLQNVVITRIPNPPKNELEEYVAREYMLSKNMPPHIVDNILWLKQNNYCVRVLKQGIGRGIRSPEDMIVIWFADPRMPYYNSPKAKPLINAIPHRFLGNYAQAVIFNSNGELDASLAMNHDAIVL